MIRKFILITAAAASLLWQSGCATTCFDFRQSEISTTTVQKLVKTTKSWDGELLPTYPYGQPEITILKIAIPPGARLDKHSHPVINAGVLLSGELMVVTTDGQTLQLKAGDAIVEVVNKLHYGINQGAAPAEIIVFYAGVADMPITIIENQ